MLLQPYFPGMIRPIARNFFTLVFLLLILMQSRLSSLCADLHRGSRDEGITQSVEDRGLVLQTRDSHPVSPTLLSPSTIASYSRIGLLFVVNTNRDVSGTDDVGVALLNLFNFVKVDSKPAKALSVLLEVFDAGGEPLTSTDVIAFFKSRFPDEDADAVFASDSDYDAGRQVRSIELDFN